MKQHELLHNEQQHVQGQGRRDALGLVSNEAYLIRSTEQMNIACDCF